MASGDAPAIRPRNRADARERGHEPRDRFAAPRALLAAHECILYRAGGAAATWRLAGPRGEEEVSVRGRVDTDEMAFVRAMLLAGLGVALAPLPVFAPLLEAGALERVLPRYARRSAPVHVVWPSRRFEPAAVTLFREALAEALPRTLERAGVARRPGA